MSKHIPVRHCIACRQAKPKLELLRVVRSPDGHVAIDKTGKLNGRGAYLCRSAECLLLAQKKRSLERQLKQTIEPAVYDCLAEQLNECNG
jgi:hypothetical protein